jgi:hypothetical protein
LVHPLPSFSSLSPFLNWLHQVSLCHSHTCTEYTSAIFNLHYFFHLSLHLPLLPFP